MCRPHVPSRLFDVGHNLARAFARETQHLANLEHRTLPAVSDSFSDSHDHFLVMQFIPGDDLGTPLTQRSRPFRAGQLVARAEQLLDALEYLRTHKPELIIYHDIKSANLKLEGDSSSMLLDFGLALDQFAEMSRITSGAHPQLFPLEQIDRLAVDARTDLYALDAMLQMLLARTAAVSALRRERDVFRR